MASAAGAPETDATRDSTSAPRQIDTTGPEQTIDNPLLTFDDRLPRFAGRTELEEYVFRFTEKNDRELRDRYELLVFGARLARDKHRAITNEKGYLTASEIDLLENEDEKGFWKQSKFFKATILTASLAGMVQGWTQSATNGTIYGVPEQFDLCVKFGSGCDGDLWTFGMLNSIPYLAAGLFGTVIADPLQENVLGRRGSVMLSCIIGAAATIGASASQTVAQLAVCRAINGIALGAKASIAPIYAAEISPPHIRGAILANWQLADAAGIFFGFLANLLVVVYVKDAVKSWRVLTNTALIPTICLLILIYLMPESPRYLMKHGRYKKALDAFTQIQTTRLLASRDLMKAHAQLDFENRLLQRDSNEETIIGSATGIPGGAPQARTGHPVLANTEKAEEHNPYAYHIGATGYFKRLIQLWKIPRCRRALLAASVAMISQQMSGVNTVAFLGTMIFKDSLGNNGNEIPGNNNNQDLDEERRKAIIVAAIGVAFGAANYLAGLPAYWLSDRVGRSVMLALGLPNMAWSMLVFACLFQIPDKAVRVPLVSVFAVVFVIFYGPTAGTSPFSISAEVFPLVSREAGMAVAVAVNLLGVGLLVLVFPFIWYKIGDTGALSIFAGLNLVAFVLVYLFVPETRQRTLEELQYTFDLSTKLHVKYRTTVIRQHLTENAWKYLTRQEVRAPVQFFMWGGKIHDDSDTEMATGNNSEENLTE